MLTTFRFRATLLLTFASVGSAQVQPGEILVSRTHPGRLAHHRTDGTFVNGVNAIDPMAGAALDADGNWVTSVRFTVESWIHTYSPIGQFLSSFTAHELSNGPGDLDLFADGARVVSDTYADEVELYAPGGMHLNTLSTPGMQFPTGVLVDSSDELWVADRQADVLWHFDRSGAALPPIQIHGGEEPDDVDEGLDGTLWLSSLTGTSLWNYTQDGTLLGQFAIGSTPSHLTIPKGTIGVRYCSPAVPHSRGVAARLTLEGSDRVSDQEGAVTPPGSQGRLCIAGTIGRHSRPGEIFQGPVGTPGVDLGALPTTPMTAVMSGDTWSFQAWFRDGSQNNFTDAVQVLFR
ncbi:MAG: hypothetical protein GY711_28955 [bacterium]|nr:hypothetical protein [bacterium]